MYPPQPPRRRSGGGWGRLLLVLIIIGAVFYGGLRLFSPWAFHMGGGSHLIPMWQGVGRMHSKTSGGDYAIYLYLWPSSGRLRLAYVSGQGMLCTPRGEQIFLKLGGNFQKNPGADLNGADARFYLYDRTAKRALLGGNSQYRLEFKGRWVNPDLVLDDDGSLERNFDPEGKPWPKGRNSGPSMGEVVPVTVKQGSKADFEAACAAIKK